MPVNRNHTVAPLSRGEILPYTPVFRVLKQTLSVVGWFGNTACPDLQHLHFVLKAI